MQRHSLSERVIEVRVITSLSLAFHTAPARWCSGTVARCLSHLRGCRALSGLRSGSIDQAWEAVLTVLTSLVPLFSFLRWICGPHSVADDTFCF